MLRVTRTCAIDHIRRRKARPPAQDLPAEEMHGLADEAPGPYQHAEHQERKNQVHRALARLSEIHREILMMKEIQGMPLIEVARILDIPLGTAKSRANRARLELAQQVMALDGGPDLGAANEGRR
jgi:RNA polymerase sigma-70 factor (ECF subfamily)